MPKGRGARPSLLGRAIETDVEFLEESSRREKPGSVNADNGTSVNADSGKSVGTGKGKNANQGVDANDTLVNLTIKVPLTYRRHWQIEAKRLDRSVTSLIMDALQEKLGLPNR